MNELVLIRGLPGSGKSTIARSMPHFHIEADQYFERNGSYKFDPMRLKKAHSWCLSATRNALRGGDVVVANTFTTRAEMEPYFALADELGASIRVIEAKGNYGSVHQVPAETIERMRNRWEQLEAA